MVRPNILDPQFVYVPAARTDIRATFARIRAQMKCEKETSKQSSSEPRKPQAARSERSSGSAGAVRPTGS